MLFTAASRIFQGSPVGAVGALNVVTASPVRCLGYTISASVAAVSATITITNGAGTIIYNTHQTDAIGSSIIVFGEPFIADSGLGFTSGGIGGGFHVLFSLSFFFTQAGS